MIISLNKQQLLSILSSFFKTDVSDIIILDNIADIIQTAIGPFIIAQGVSGKIPAIKALRQLAVDNKLVENAMGLGDAKFAVEHFSEFIAFVKDKGRLPKDGYNSIEHGSYVADFK